MKAVISRWVGFRAVCSEDLEESMAIAVDSPESIFKGKRARKSKKSNRPKRRSSCRKRNAKRCNKSKK